MTVFTVELAAYEPGLCYEPGFPPATYRGITFGFAELAEMFDAHPSGDGVILLGSFVEADNIQLTVEAMDPAHRMVHFGVTGLAHYYDVSIWRDRVEIQIYTNDAACYLLSVNFPETRKEVRRAFEVIVMEWERSKRALPAT